MKLLIPASRLPEVTKKVVNWIDALLKPSDIATVTSAIESVDLEDAQVLFSSSKLLVYVLYFSYQYHFIA